MNDIFYFTNEQLDRYHRDAQFHALVSKLRDELVEIWSRTGVGELLTVEVYSFHLAEVLLDGAGRDTSLVNLLLRLHAQPSVEYAKSDDTWPEWYR